MSAVMPHASFICYPALPAAAILSCDYQPKPDDQPCCSIQCSRQTNQQLFPHTCIALEISFASARCRCNQADRGTADWGGALPEDWFSCCRKLQDQYIKTQVGMRLKIERERCQACTEVLRCTEGVRRVCGGRTEGVQRANRGHTEACRGLRRVYRGVYRGGSRDRGIP